MADIRAKWTSGHSGSPLTGVEVLLVNIPGFSFQGNFGEILIKGDNVSKGYFDSTGSGGNFLDGWFRTGDIGMWVTEGTSAKARNQIKVIERKENLVKLRSGFMIASKRNSFTVEKMSWLLTLIWKVYTVKHSSNLWLKICPKTLSIEGNQCRWMKS